MTDSQIVSIKHPDQFFIDGRWTKPSSDSMIDVRNSGTEEIYLRVAEAQEADINRAVDAARKAFDQGPWPQMSHAERAVYLRAIGREMAARQGEVADIWTMESGIVHSLAKGGAAALEGTYNTYADLASTYPWETLKTPSPGSGNVGLIVREPVGVVAAIIPWNGPAGLAAHKCGPALLAGCTVVLKCSPEARVRLTCWRKLAKRSACPRAC